MKKNNTLIACATSLLAVTSSFAATSTWTGDAAATGNTVGDWNVTSPGNWSGDVAPTYGNTADIEIAGTLDLDQYVRTNLTIRSLEFTSTNTGDTAIGLRAGNDNARNLTFSADSGNSTLTIDASATGNKVIGRNLAGTNTSGSVVLSSNLDITNNGDGRLSFHGAVTGTGNVTISGTDRTQFYGINTYTGNTTINDLSGEKAVFGNGSEMAFTIGADGVNNAILGTGNVDLNGIFRLDLGGASTTVGASWLLVAVDTLGEDYKPNFDLQTVAGSFTEDAGLWSINENGVDYEFAESTGLLSVVPEPGTYALLAGLTGLVFVMVRRRRD